MNRPLYIFIPTRGRVDKQKTYKGIAAIRQYILEMNKGKFIVMLDDDITFQIKLKNSSKIINSTSREVLDAFNW